MDTQIAVVETTIKQRVLAMLEVVLDDLPQLIADTDFDPFTKRIIEKLVRTQLPKMISDALDKIPDEQLEQQIVKLRDDILPFVLGYDERYDVDRSS